MGNDTTRTQTEAQLQSEIALAFNRGRTRLYKNVAGNYWTGRLVEFTNGIAKLASARRIKTGMVTGAADRIGFHQITITPEMCGKTIAVYAAIELKTDTGQLRPEQKQFLKVTEDMGGIAGVARSVEDVNTIFHNYVKKISC